MMRIFSLGAILRIIANVLGIIRSVIPSTDRLLGRKEMEVSQHEKANKAREQMEDVPESDARDLPDRLRKNGL